jgi:hypothetical protein
MWKFSDSHCQWKFSGSRCHHMIVGANLLTRGDEEDNEPHKYVRPNSVVIVFIAYHPKIVGQIHCQI